MANDENPLPVENQDDAALRALGESIFSSYGKFLLPSGKVVSGDEMQAFSSAMANPDIESIQFHDRNWYGSAGPVEFSEPSNPLSSVNDRWTGDPKTDRMLLVARALEANELVRERTRSQIIQPEQIPMHHYQSDQPPAHSNWIVQLFHRLRRR